MKSKIDVFESRWTLVNGYRMHAKLESRAAFENQPPVVLVHGLGVSHRYWAPTAALLAERFNVYLPDLPGFGSSQKPQRSLDIPELAEALGCWMEANALPCAALMGNSMGCQVIAELAVRKPQLVERLVFTGPSIDPQRRSMVGQLFNAARDVVHEPPRLLGIVFTDYFIAGPRRTMTTLRYAIHHPMDARLPYIPAPVLVVRGEYDRFVSQEWAQRIAARVPQGRVEVIRGAAHGVIYSAPEPLTALVEQFIGARE